MVNPRLLAVFIRHDGQRDTGLTLAERIGNINVDAGADREDLLEL